MRIFSTITTTITVFTLTLLFVSNVASLSPKDNAAKDHIQTLSAISSPDENERWNAAREIGRARKNTVGELLKVIESPVKKQENFVDLGTPRNLAIALLGDMRAAEAAAPLCGWLVPHEGQVLIYGRDIVMPPAVFALVKIGKPSSVECLKRLGLEANDHKGPMGFSRRHLLLYVITSVEGEEVAKFMLQCAIEKEKDAKRKANLGSALDLHEKWIKEREEREKKRREKKETEFSLNLHKVTIGMNMQNVEELLGKPDRIETPEDHVGTWLVGTSEVWVYGKRRENGTVYFDTNRKVRLVYEHQSRIAPPE